MRKELLVAGALSLLAHWALFQIPLFSKGSGNLLQSQKDLEVSINWKTPVSFPKEMSPEPNDNSRVGPQGNDVSEDVESPRQQIQANETSPKEVTHQKKKAKPKSEKMTLPSSPDRSEEVSENSQKDSSQASSRIQTVEGATSGQGEWNPPGDSKGQSSGAQAPSQPSRGPEEEIKKAFPRYDLNPKPPYPDVARRRGHEGVVVLSVLVLKDGSVGKIAVARSSGYDLLDSAALETVAKWRFVPAKVGDEPVDMEVQVPIRFKLE